jgi:hypothetical protein
MNYDSDKKTIRSPSEFKKYVTIEIGYVPILGPVDHTELLYQKEAARLALLTYTASRNFRNIWFHYSVSLHNRFHPTADGHPFGNFHSAL